MKARHAAPFTRAQRKLLERWLITAATVYGFVMIVVLAAIMTSDAPDENTPSQYGVASQTPGVQRDRKRPMPTSPQMTDGYNKAADRTMSENGPNAAPPTTVARVPVPEVDELGEAPMWPGGPDAGSIVEHDMTPDGQRLTVRANPISDR